MHYITGANTNSAQCKYLPIPSNLWMVDRTGFWNVGYCQQLQHVQGHPMDQFPKISVLQAKFSWLGNLEKLICPWKESVAGQYTIQGVRGDLVYTKYLVYSDYLFISLPSTEGVNVSLRPHPIAYIPPSPIEGLNFAL